MTLFLPDFDRLTVDQGLAFVERARRQLDRFEQLPHAKGKPMDPAVVAEARALLDKVERDIHAFVTQIHSAD
ncbi:MAG: hypothetical protein AB7N65_22535 [Vicinamibacterales bacterium]